MIFFDWKDLTNNFEDWSELSNENKSGFIIKTIISIVFILMFVWTLIAPAILKNRDFNHDI
jgi:hypothetical protein